MSDIGARFVACRRWRWLPGMVDTLGNRMDDDGWPSYSTIDHGASGVVEVATWTLPAPWGAVPNVEDPATLGCILALVREAWGAPFGQVSPALMDGAWWTFYANKPDGDCAIVGKTEAAALLAALEAAP